MFSVNLLGYGLEQPGIESHKRKEIFLFFWNVQTSFGAFPASNSMGARFLARRL